MTIRDGLLPYCSYTNISPSILYWSKAFSEKRVQMVALALTAVCLVLLFCPPSLPSTQIIATYNVTGTPIANNASNTPKLKIALVMSVTGNTPHHYQTAMDSMRCYAQIHNYTFLLAFGEHYEKVCPHKQIIFRRHCIMAHLLPQYDYLIMFDADIGVVNPLRKMEEFIDPDYDVTFYDRFFNYEIAIGSYILKNTTYAQQFIMGFADCENRLPKSFHGTENGVLHKYIADKLFPNRPEVYEPCLIIYRLSKNFEDLFTYESCIRAVLGAMETFPHIKIFRKGTGWVRDAWISNSMWNPKNPRDFMLHGWKEYARSNYTQRELPIRPTHDNSINWMNPLLGDFDLKKCVPRNTTWNYDKNLISTSGNIEKALNEYQAEIQGQYYKSLARIRDLLRY